MREEKVFARHTITRGSYRNRGSEDHGNVEHEFEKGFHVNSNSCRRKSREYRRKEHKENAKFFFECVFAFEASFCTLLLQLTNPIHLD